MTTEPTIYHALRTREDWLREAIIHIHNSGRMPNLPEVRASCGWTLTNSRKNGGSCHKPEYSADGLTEIFLSPKLADPVDVLATLLHELIHSLGIWDHGPTFRAHMAPLGLAGKPTATIAGQEFGDIWGQTLLALGPYPHASLDPGEGRQKQGTRMLKIICPKCGYTCRSTAKWISVGLPTCPCGSAMELDLPDEKKGADN